MIVRGGKGGQTQIWRKFFVFYRKGQGWIAPPRIILLFHLHIFLNIFLLVYFVFIFNLSPSLQTEMDKLLQDIHYHHHRCSALRQAPGTHSLHSFLPSALLFIFMNEPSIRSSIIPLLGLPRGLFPNILPSNTSFLFSTGRRLLFEKELKTFFVKNLGNIFSP